MRSAGRTAIVVLIGVMAASCRTYSEPEAALRAYARAVRERQCAESLGQVSSRTRYALEMLRGKPQHPHNPLPLEEYYCNKFAFEDCKLDDLTLNRADDSIATVSMSCGRTQDSFLPGFPSIFLKYEPRDFELVREDGRWRVVLPHVIKIVEVREREDQLRDKALREQQAAQKRRANSDPP